MAEPDRNADRSENAWVPGLCAREALSALVKALRATRRHPAASAVRAASRRELVQAVRKTLVHGPLAIRLDADGPTLAGDSGVPGDSGPGQAPFDLLVTDADPVQLAALVDRWSSGGLSATSPDRPATQVYGPHPPTEG